MGIDLSQFHQVFFEESFEGLDVMEAALLDLDPENIDGETINAIFRSAHSIKGGSATFGFTSVSEFTHDMETLLDQVRAGKRGLSADDVGLFLKSVDCIKEMLGLIQGGDEGHTEESETLKAKFAQLLNGDSLESPLGEAVADDASTVPESKADDATASKVDTPQASESLLKRWMIHFIPGREILKTGNDPLRIFKELNEGGEFKKIELSSHMPPFHSMESEDCWLEWNLIYETEKDREVIDTAFEWVADESELNIVELKGGKYFSIHFSPGADILRSGNEPIRLIRALQEFGHVDIAAEIENLPNFSSIDSEQCLLSWKLTLFSDEVSIEQVREVFEWVSDESDIDIEEHLFSESRPNAVSDSKLQADKDSVLEPSQDVAAPIEKPATEKIENAEKTESVSATKKKAAKKTGAETSSIRVGIDKVDNLINMVGELVITQSMLGQLGEEFDIEKLPKLIEGLGQLEQNTRELQESVMRIRMLPISFAFSRFPRMVRDLGQTLGKSVSLEMLGEQTELDKTVMEKIGDPLVHLVRNAVDHGLEMPEERLANGKEETGNITLNAYHQGGNVVIEIIDDGRGLNRDAIASKAVDKGIISSGDADFMSNEQIYDLIFQPGFSTAKQVSDVSGRGVGMDVVKRNIQALNGVVEIQSTPNQGSKIIIRLPLTLAILDGQLIRVGKEIYIFPLVSIVESLQCDQDSISSVAGGCSVFKLRDDYVPIIELYKTFAIEPDSKELEDSLLVVVECDGDKVGIVVDELLAQQQVVIKSLEQNYKRVDGISGATILGDGTVALILDIPGIVKIAGEKFDLNQHMPSNIHNLITQLTGSRQLLN